MGVKPNPLYLLLNAGYSYYNPDYTGDMGVKPNPLYLLLNTARIRILTIKEIWESNLTLSIFS